MVDALHEVHRVLAPRGLLVDARPDSHVLAHAEHVTPRGPRSIGTIRTARVELGNDKASDRAIARVKREGIFDSRRAGRFWHRVPFDDLSALVEYLRDHLRFEHRVRWTVDAKTRRRIGDDRFTIRRAVHFELLDRR